MSTARTRLFLGLACALGLSVALVLPPSSAQTIVNDPPHQISNLMNHLKDMLEKATKWAKDYQHYARQIQHYQQQLVKVGGLAASFQIPEGQPLQKVDEYYLVHEACYTTPGFSLQALGVAMRIDPHGDLIEQQKRICANIQRIHNRKHNETVDFLQKTAREMEASIKEMEARRNRNNDEGTVNASNNDALLTSTRIDAFITEWESRMRSYDDYVASLRRQQAILARDALRGRKTAVGTVVRTAALKAALED